MGQYNINFIYNIRFSLHDFTSLLVVIYKQKFIFCYISHYLHLLVTLYCILTYNFMKFYCDLFIFFFYPGDQICFGLTGRSLRERIIGTWFCLI